MLYHQLVRLAIAAGLLLAAATSTAEDQARIALLIGNKGYTLKVGPLKNPHHDIALVGAALKKINFDVTLIEDADYRTMDTAIKQFVDKVRRAGPGAISFFYYSGHGAANPDTQINYLIPVDVADSDNAAIWFQSFGQTALINQLSDQARTATHYVVFDACRTELNLPSAPGKALGSNKGFEPVAHAGSLLIAYATAPTKAASDIGEGGGPYAQALADELIKPGVESVTMFRNVQIRVKQAIGQDPWLSFGAIPPIYLAGQHASSPELKIEGGAAVPPLQGYVFHDCPACPEMVVVRAGEFTMGSPDDEPNRDDDEGPQRIVTIAQPFAVGKFEVTFAEWAACVADDGCKNHTSPNDSGWGKERRPVIDVSWSDAKEYVAWLSDETNQPYRLLTEAEWEYMARAETTTRYVPGDTITTQDGQFSQEGLGGARNTAPVGSSKPNRFGLYDVHGNVWEWVEDCYADSYGAASPTNSPGAPPRCNARVLRGGSWNNSSPYLRLANRNRSHPHYRTDSIGFRVARALMP